MHTELFQLSAPLMGLVGVSERARADARIILGAMALAPHVAGITCQEDGETILITISYDYGPNVEIRIYDQPAI